MTRRASGLQITPPAITTGSPRGTDPTLNILTCNNKRNKAVVYKQRKYGNTITVIKLLVGHSSVAELSLITSNCTTMTVIMKTYEKMEPSKTVCHSPTANWWPSFHLCTYSICLFRIKLEIRGK